MPSEADTCRKCVVPKPQAAGWDDEPHSIAEQRTITDGRIVSVGKEFVLKPPRRVDFPLRYTRDFPLAQQIVEAFPWDTAPRNLLRDRDAIYGDRFRRRVCRFPIQEVLTAPRSPWQNPYMERIIGSIRRDCLDHVIVFNERHLKCSLKTTLTITTAGDLILAWASIPHRAGTFRLRTAAK